MVQFSWSGTRRGICDRSVYVEGVGYLLWCLVQDWLVEVPLAKLLWQHGLLNPLECHGLAYYPWTPFIR